MNRRLTALLLGVLMLSWRSFGAQTLPTAEVLTVYPCVTEGEGPPVTDQD